MISIRIRSPSDSSRTGWRTRSLTSNSSISSPWVLSNSACRQRVDFAVKLERIGGRQVPPELVLLAHDERELPAEGVGPVPRRVAEHAGRAAGRVDEAGEHLEGGGLAGPVRPEERDHFAGFDGEADAVDGPDLLVFAVEEGARPR